MFLDIDDCFREDSDESDSFLSSVFAVLIVFDMVDCFRNASADGSNLTSEVLTVLDTVDCLNEDSNEKDVLGKLLVTKSPFSNEELTVNDCLGEFSVNIAACFREPYSKLALFRLTLCCCSTVHCVVPD